MEYSTDQTFIKASGTPCTEGNTAVSAGVYYVRYTETTNYEAGGPFR